MDNLLKKTMLSFKSHCPQVDKWSKMSDEFRIIFNVMMVESKLWKDLTENLPVINDFAL